jgi:hypothetical protein
MNKLSQVSIGIGAAGVAFFAGFWSLGGRGGLKVLLLSSVLSTPAIVILTGQSRERIERLEEELSQTHSSLATAEQKHKREQSHLAGLNSQLTSDLQATKQSLTEIQATLKESNREIEKANQHRDRAIKAISDLQRAIAGLNRKLEAAQGETEELKAEVGAWESEFEDRVDVEAERRFQVAKKAEIERVFAEHDGITAEAIRIAHGLQAWGEKVGSAHEAKRQLIKEMAGAYNQNLDELSATIEQERSEYLNRIELLTEKVARLQQQLEGDLIEPSYGQFGYSVEGKIANDIARKVWEDLNIPLAVTGYHIRSDGSINAGYSYSHSIGVETILCDLNRHTGDLVKWLGIHCITSIKKHEISDLIIISLRREPPIKEEELKRLFTPIEKLATQVIREMSRKGTIRIMGATGDGKGIAARYLLSRIIQTQPWFIRLHDPQHGSAEDYWGIAKVSQSGDEMKQALKAISTQMVDRETSKNHVPITLDILDEIDTQLNKSDKKQFLNLVSRIRHLGMKLILIGQNPKVSRAGFQWADMEQMICLYQGSSALDAIKNNPALALRKEILLKQYGQIAESIQAKNEWLDDAKKHYFGLCVTPGKSAQWYELPIADQIEIDSECELISDKFSIPINTSLFVNPKNYATPVADDLAQPVNMAQNGNCQTVTGKGLHAHGNLGDNATIDQSNAETATPAKPTCKNHLGAKLSQGKDQRYYCSLCKRKLRKLEVIWQ